MYGNTTEIIPGNQNKKWTVYFKSLYSNTSEFVEKVRFKLHETFNPNVVEVTEYPFEVTRSGWGAFEIKIRVYWK